MALASKASITLNKRRRSKNKYYRITFKSKQIRLLLDKVLLFRYLRLIHGRFWGVTAISGMLFGFAICFAIRPDMINISTAISDFASDFRTAPYFAGSVFFAAYGMWRWRVYLSRTWKKSMPVIGLVSLTIFGLYLVALTPVAWEPVYFVHMFGVSLAGLSMFATVVLDGLLSRTKKSGNILLWRFLRFMSFFMIILGGWFTLGSAKAIGWYDVSLLGESLLVAGYFIWIIIKTYQGHGKSTLLGKFVHDFVRID